MRVITKVAKTTAPTVIATIGNIVLSVSVPVFGSIYTPAANVAEAPKTCPVVPPVDIVCGLYDL